MSRKKQSAYSSMDYAGMSAAARDAMEAELRRHWFAPRYQCAPFDASELATLAMEQWPDRPELAEALCGCTEQWRKDGFYAFLQDPAGSSRWGMFLGSFPIESPRQGAMIVDMLEDGSILGIEFVDALMRQHYDGRDGARVPQGPPELKIVHWKDRSGGSL